MTVETFDVEQGTDAWLRCRMGVPTASEFATVMAKGKNGGESLTRKTYMYKLAGEIVSGEPMESYSNWHMDRGKIMEADAREFYCFTHDVEPVRVGFIKNGNVGCSPDFLIEDEGVAEIKTKLPHLLIELLLKDDFPPEHKAQCQGALWVSERNWVDIVCYWPGVPKLVKRAYRDSGYIAEIKRAVDQFNAELHEVVQRVKSYGVAA